MKYFEASIDVDHFLFELSEAADRPNDKLLEQKHVSEQHHGIYFVLIAWVQDAKNTRKGKHRYRYQIHPQWKPGGNSTVPLVGQDVLV